MLKLLTEATCLQDAVRFTWSAIGCAVARRRSDVPVELSRDVRAPVVRATTSFSSKMEVASSPEKSNPHAKKDKLWAGYLVSEPSDDGGRRWLENWEAARFVRQAGSSAKGQP